MGLKIGGWRIMLMVDEDWLEKMIKCNASKVIMAREASNSSDWGKEGGDAMKVMSR